MDRIIEKKKWPPKKIAMYAFGALVLAAIVYSLVFASHESRLNVHADRLTISDVQRGLFLDYIPANGTVMPLKTVYLDAVEGGQVDTLFVEEGAVLKEGQPILRLTNTNLLLDIMYREAELFQQINNLRNTRLSMQQNELSLKSALLELDNQIADQRRAFQRDKELYDKNLISKIQYEDSRDQYHYLQQRRALTLENHRIDSTFRSAQIEQLEEGVDRMRSNLELIKERQDKLTLRSPIRGQLTSLNAEVGQSKASGQRLGQVDMLDGFKVRAGIDEHFIARIQTGLKGEFDFDNNTYNLTITKVYPEVVNGRFEVDLEFDGKEPGGIRRGQTVRIRLELGGSNEAILLSRGGFYQSTGGQWVYVVGSGGDYAVKRHIQIGRQNPQYYEVLDGLEPGEKVITSSYDTFGDVDRLVLKR